MKRLFIVLVVLVLSVAAVFADSHGSGMYGMPEGDWSIVGGRLFQKNAAAPRAKAWLMVPQKGAMVYEFTMRYEGGGEDGHGGVGIHMLGDRTSKGKAWGMGDSWLLWLNYDEKPRNKDITAGLSAQLYKSTNNSTMNVVKSLSLSRYEPVLMANLNRDIPVKLTFLPDRGRLLIADPTGASAGWYLDMPGSKGDQGMYVAARTNGLKASFTSPDVNL